MRPQKNPTRICKVRAATLMTNATSRKVMLASKNKMYQTRKTQRLKIQVASRRNRKKARTKKNSKKRKVAKKKLRSQNNLR